MATKAQIETVIDTNLADASSITASEHRDTLIDNSNSVLAELYKTSAVSDTQATTTVFTISGSNKQYTFSIKKAGGSVTVNGIFFSTGSVMLGTDTAWATITNSEYTPSVNTYFLGYGTYSGDPIRMSIYNNGGTWELRTVDAVAALETVSFCITYFVGQ